MPRETRFSMVTRVRLPASEHHDFIAAAKRLGESRSTLLRRAVRDIIDRPATLLDIELGVLVQAVYQLKAVGRNLNQLTQAVHIGKGTVIEPASLDALRAAVGSLDARVTDLVQKSRLRQVSRK